jgi:hypothetical protein
MPRPTAEASPSTPKQRETHTDPGRAHYWLRSRLRAQGLLPRRLPQFLSWCAEPSRGWLRITNAYEFRHRELLDHLVPPQSSSDGELKRG